MHVNPLSKNARSAKTNSIYAGKTSGSGPLEARKSADMPYRRGARFRTKYRGRFYFCQSQQHVKTGPRLLLNERRHAARHRHPAASVTKSGDGRPNTVVATTTVPAGSAVHRQANHAEEKDGETHSLVANALNNSPISITTSRSDAEVFGRPFQLRRWPPRNNTAMRCRGECLLKR